MSEELDYLTQGQLDAIRKLLANGYDLPANLARRLLADHDAWVVRAFTAHRTDEETPLDKRMETVFTRDMEATETQEVPMSHSRDFAALRYWRKFGGLTADEVTEAYWLAMARDNVVDWIGPAITDGFRTANAEYFMTDGRN